MASLQLRDGTHVTVRPIRAGDRELLERGFERLSDDSRYRRFLSPIARLSSAQLRYLTDVDHHDHEALAALGPDGEFIGVARYVRSADEPGVAEAAVTVADDWQGRGLGSALLAALAERARAEDVHCFSALVQPDNVRSLRMLEGVGDAVRKLDGGVVELRVELPETGLPPQLQDLLRAAAARSLVVVGTVLHRATGVLRGPLPEPPPVVTGRGIKTVVAGVDGSRSSLRAARAAFDLSRRLGCRLHLVSAYNPHVPPMLREAHHWVPEQVSPLSWLVAGREDAEAILADTAADGDGRVTTHAWPGDPAEALIAVAEEQDADLIVVGSKGMTGSGRFLLGSVAAKVARHAPCSVLIVKTT